MLIRNSEMLMLVADLRDLLLYKRAQDKCDCNVGVGSVREYQKRGFRRRKGRAWCEVASELGYDGGGVGQVGIGLGEAGCRELGDLFR